MAQASMAVWGDATVRAFATSLLELALDDGSVEHRKRVLNFCAVRWDIPLAVLAAYLAGVWLAARRPPRPAGAWADSAFAAWNLGLSLFSFWGAWEMGVWLHRAVAAKGYFFTVCSDPYTLETQSSHATLALFLFAFSKIPELGDTAFLILRGKPVRFLQWYHHSTVMLFCWLAIATEYTPGIWFAMTNYVVHAVMYMYFFLMTFGSLKRVVKVVAPLVTIIQITQMLYGLFINGFAVWNYAVGNYCHIQDVAVYSAVAMYASYFVLFSQLFVESRRSKARARASKLPAASQRVHEQEQPSAIEQVVKDASRKPSGDWRRRAVSAGLL